MINLKYRDIQFPPDNFQFIKEECVLIKENNAFILCEKQDNTVLKKQHFVSNKNKILMQLSHHNATDNDGSPFSTTHFLHNIFFPIFVLNKAYPNTTFIFKMLKNKDSLFSELYYFLLNILRFNNIEYELIDDDVNLININNFFIYKRNIIESPPIENNHNYDLPKQMISQISNNINPQKVVLFLSKHFNKNDITNYGLYIDEIVKNNVEIFDINNINGLDSLLNYLNDVKVAIINDSSDIDLFLLFMPVGSTIIFPNFKDDERDLASLIFQNDDVRKTYSMFFKKIILTKNLMEILKCLKK